MSFNDRLDQHKETGASHARTWDIAEKTLSDEMTIIQMIMMPEPPDFAKFVVGGTKGLLVCTGAKTDEGENIYPLDILRWKENGLSVGVVKYGRHEYHNLRGYGWYIDCGDYGIGLWDGGGFELLGSYLTNPELLPKGMKEEVDVRWALQLL